MSHLEKLARALCLENIKGFNDGAFAAMSDNLTKRPVSRYDKLVDRHYRKHLPQAKILLDEAAKTWEGLQRGRQ